MFLADWLNGGALLGSLILPAALWVARRQT
jgi:hypothetical protein